ncbi:hypothetical protein V2J09_018168 [Rumex salicifolius]
MGVLLRDSVLLGAFSKETRSPRSLHGTPLTHIQAAVNVGLWAPISIGGVQLSHLFFDDLLLFAEAWVDQANVIKSYLDHLCAASGERISYRKSTLFVGKSVNATMRTQVRTALEIPLADDVGKYLGV